MWKNSDQFDKTDMVRHPILLRGVGDAGLRGLTCSNLYIDQITIVFRDPASMNPSEFWPGDSALYTWNIETQTLQVGVNPGLENGTWTQQSEPVTRLERAFTYSGSYTQHGLGQLTLENYYIKIYRPNRDLPVATNLQNVGNFILHLQFPLIYLDTKTFRVDIPDNRIQYVVVEFSAEE